MESPIVRTQSPVVCTDPVCGMTVQSEFARSQGLTFVHDGTEFCFCGRGCRLEFEADPVMYLSPDYVPSM